MEQLLPKYSCVKGNVYKRSAPYFFRVSCGTLNSNQSKNCKYVIEFSFIQLRPFDRDMFWTYFLQVFSNFASICKSWKDTEVIHYRDKNLWGILEALAFIISGGHQSFSCGRSHLIKLSDWKANVFMVSDLSCIHIERNRHRFQWRQVLCQ